MNKNKTYIISCIITLFVTILILAFGFTNNHFAEPLDVYQIYLDGETIGMIDNQDELYKLINEGQSDIKNEYNVDQVYPPKGFEIVAHRTYNNNLTDANTIYDLIKNEHDFTIKGYTITIKPKPEEDDEEKETTPIVFNVLDKKVFEDAIDAYISTFVGKDEYENYINENQEEITDTGEIIDNMYFEDTITIKEGYISVGEEIYTNSSDLVKKLLFGKNVESETYEVKKGDTLESIAYDNKLNVGELLIANENLKNENTILAIGQEINIALIEPQLTLIYDLEVKEVIEVPFQTEKKYDDSRYSGYKKLETPGINGLQKITKQVRVVNGEMNQDAYITEEEVIRQPQNEVYIYGSKYSGGGGNQIDTGDTWGYPTNFPYVITSEYGYRWGTLHDGIDISGTGYGSPIYAVLDGEVVNAGWGGFVGNSAGYNVVIKHNNGYYTVYAHMSTKPPVKVGDYVERGQQIGKMGDTGWTTGPHLHLGVFIGMPYNGGTPINPRRIIRF